MTSHGTDKSIVMWQEQANGYQPEALLITDCDDEILIEQRDGTVSISKDSLKEFIKTLSSMKMNKAE